VIVQRSIADTFNAQFHEYMTSVDNHAAAGIDRNLPSKMQNLHRMVDLLIDTVDKTKKQALEFKEKY